MPDPESPEQPSEGVAKTAGGLLAVGALVAAKFLIKAGVVGGVALGTSQAKIEASRFQDWSERTRAGVKTFCVQVAKAQLEEGESISERQRAAMEPFFGKHCDCLVKDMEESHMIHTKVSKLSSDQEAEEKLLGDLRGYYVSQRGREAQERCSSAALAQLDDGSSAGRSTASE